MAYNHFQGVIKKNSLSKWLFALMTMLFTAAISAGIISSAQAAHNPAVVTYDLGMCTPSTFSATVTDPDAGHLISNMYLVVSADGDTQFANIPTDGTSADISVGPFAADTTVYWNVFGGGERDYDQPLWNGYGTPSFGADITAYAADQGGFSWVLDGPENPNPFTNFNEVEVSGCSPEVKDDCKNGGWEMYGFKNQGQCIRFVNTGKDSR